MFCIIYSVQCPQLIYYIILQTGTIITKYNNEVISLLRNK